MKKLKILPSILMLVLCVGVLAVGAFAITPTQNTISGSITVNAVPQEVTIQMNIKNAEGGDKIGKIRTIRAGETFALGDIAFNLENANTTIDVKDIIIEFNIKNTATATSTTEKQEKALGAFFAKNTVSIADGEYAKGTDIFTNGTITNEEGTITYVNIYADSYMAIMPQETVCLSMRFSIASFESLEAPIEYLLFIEHYTSGNNDGLLKLPITAGESTIYNTDIASGATHVAIPATYKKINSEAFAFNNTLTYVTIPNSVETTDDYIFWNCKTLKTITTPEKITEIKGFTFSGCSGLKRVNLGSSTNLITIGYEAFAGCSSLTEITIPSSVESIMGYAFIACDSLIKIDFEGTMAQWNAIDKTDAQIKVGVVVKCSDGDITI